jgi:hypothetical protein
LKERIIKNMTEYSNKFKFIKINYWLAKHW